MLETKCPILLFSDENKNWRWNVQKHSSLGKKHSFIFINYYLFYKTRLKRILLNYTKLYFQNLPDPSFVDEQVKIFGSWYGMNNICVFPTKISDQQKSSGDNKNDWNIIYLKHKTMLFDHKVRQLVNESSGVFHELQTSVDDPNKSTDALLFSRRYR